MKVSIIGPGSFGTSISKIISGNVDEVYLFGRSRDVIESINSENTNAVYFPLNKLNENISAYHLKDDVNKIAETDLVILSVPSGVLTEVIDDIAPYLRDKIIISGIKGISYPSLNLMTEVIQEKTQNENVFSVSGPTFADELINNVLSALTLGVDKKEYVKLVKKIFSSPNMITDSSTDVQGVEFCGVLKNVYAIALGVFDSQFYGNNSHYAFLNLCFKEMRLLLDEMGYDTSLSNNFCGFGDLNLTSGADKSRNRTIGFMIGKGIDIDLENSTITLEGFRSTKAVKRMIKDSEIKYPIINFVNDAFDNRKNVKTGLNSLLNDLKSM